MTAAPRPDEIPTNPRGEPMRKIVNSTFVTLDGVVNHMQHWHFDFVDAEMDALAMEQIQGSDALLMGRQTYDIYAGAWPGRPGYYAERINAIRKYVVSRTLTSPEWSNTEVRGGDLVDQVADLKSAPGGTILMHGFGPVAKALLAAGLLDVLHLWYHPSLVGVGDAGDRLHTDGLTVSLRQSGVQALTSGVVVLSYEATTSTQEERS